MAYRRRKYNATKVEVDGILFDSKKEANRYKALKELEQKGEIHDLRRQVKFVLIPEQRLPDWTGPKGGTHRGELLERECSYIADFVYELPDGGTVVEDCKSPVTRTPEYIIKRKLLLWLKGIRIKES